tara:strand:- start:1376 stop:1639 length:264 start_codon:yes stop_codon:yes gene_type:complete
MPEDDYLVDYDGLWVDGVFYPWTEQPEPNEDGSLPVEDLFMDPESTSTGIININPNTAINKFNDWSLINKILSMGVLWIILSTKAWK